MASKHYFNFLGHVWENLPANDSGRFSEMWHGYEQVFASVYQKYVETDLNIAISEMLPFSTERWLPYSFTSANQVLKPAVYQSNQDLSNGVDLSIKYLIKFQINSEDPIEVDLRGLNPVSTTINEIVTKINRAVGFAFATTVYENSILYFTSNISGPTSSITWLPASVPLKDAAEFVLGILVEGLPYTLPEFPFVYSLPYAKVTSIPTLQTKIRNETLDDSGINLIENTDYSVQSSDQTISFKTTPPTNLWAKRTLIDDETPYHNFGFLMGIYDKNSPQYLEILRGLWFAFWNGPTPQNLKRALYLLFTLPVAAEDTTVTSVTATEIVTTSAKGVVRTFAVPDMLLPIVTVGQELTKYAPLVSGIEVYDKIGYPGFVKTEIGRKNIQRFLTENATRGYGDTDETKALDLLEEHTFLPQINVNAFVSPDINLGNVRSFLEAIQPLNKTFWFQVIVGEFADELPLRDFIGIDVDIDITPNLDSNQTTFAPTMDLNNYEVSDNEAFNLDSEVILFQERANIEVKSFGVTINMFDA
jgi:hypothetical protein